MNSKTAVHAPVTHGIVVMIILLSVPRDTMAQETGKAKSPPRTISLDMPGETIAMDGEAGLREFVETYVAANNTKDMKKIKEMYHPKDFEAVMDFVARKPAAFDTLTLENMILQHAVPDHHPAFTVRRFLKDAPLPQAGMTDWPVPPTHGVQLQFEPEANHIVVFSLHLVRMDNRWFAVHGVPNPDFVKNMTQFAQDHKPSAETTAPGAAAKGISGSSTGIAVDTAASKRRTWTDTQGHMVEAQFVKMEDGKVHLKRENGKILKVPLERFCKQDRDFLKNQNTTAASAMTSPTTPNSQDTGTTHAATKEMVAGKRNRNPPAKNSPDTAAEGAVGSITGIAVDADGKGVEDVAVTVYRDDAKVIDRATTDANGKFVVEKVPAGVALVVHAAKKKSFLGVCGQKEHIVVQAGKTTDIGNIELKVPTHSKT